MDAIFGIYDGVEGVPRSYLAILVRFEFAGVGKGSIPMSLPIFIDWGVCPPNSSKSQKKDMFYVISLGRLSDV